MDVKTAESIVKNVREAVDKDLYIGPNLMENYIKAYDFLNNLVDETVTQASETYDKFLITCLKPYGFTEENAAEEANRVVIYEKKWDPSGNTYRYVYVDGVYAFTIRMNQIYDHDDSSYKTTITYEKIVEEHRKGERAI